MDKKGSAMVEAALIFPMVVLAVVSLIYIQIFLFGECRAQAALHRSLLCESGGLMKNYVGEMPEEIPVFQQHWKSGFRVLEARRGVSQRGGGLLLAETDRYVEGYCHLIDEGMAVRILYAVKEGVAHEEGK